MKKLSVVIPALNEEDGIRDISERVLAVEPALQEVGVDGLELIVVDDGSTDSTPEIVKSIPDVRLISHPTNKGYGAALKTGFAAAQGDCIGFLDADGTYPPEYFPQLCAAAIAHDADIVIGSRMSGSDSQMPAVRRLGNRIFANLVSLISSQKITDSASGMRVFKKDILEWVYPLPDGLNLTPVMSTRALHEELNMIEVPIPYSERVGRSKLSVVNDGMLFASSIVQTSLSYNPVRALGILSIVALGITAIIAVSLFILRISGVTALGPLGAFLVFLGVILAVAGLMTLTLGISFNYFVALFHKTPVRQGLFGKPILKQSPVPYFGVLGTVVLAIGMIVGIGALLFGLTGMPMERLWFYYLVSAGLTLIGLQLIIMWVQTQVLDTVSEREKLVLEELDQSVTNEEPILSGQARVA